jgi:predicted DsbA family dithiol-disulfide isomerase
MRVEIEIYSDVVCPWCYLGKTRLEAALATFEAEVTVRWRAFQLDPDAPHECRPLLPWLAERFSGSGAGGVDRARQTVAHVTALARAEGLSLDFDRALIANTFDAHRLLWFADQPQTVFYGAGPDTQADLAEALHRAHFTEGRDIGSFDVLVDVADQIGLDPDRVRQFLGSTEGTADVRAQIAHAHDVGITSVPTFVFAGKYAVTGAQDTATLRSVLAEVARREGLAPTLRTLIPGQRSASTHETPAESASDPRTDPDPTRS